MSRAGGVERDPGAHLLAELDYFDAAVGAALSKANVFLAIAFGATTAPFAPLMHPLNFIRKRER